MPDRRRRVFDVLQPNQGLFLGRAALAVPDRGLLDCNNVRIRDGKITNENIGYSKLFEETLGAPCTGIFDFTSSVGTSVTIFGTRHDLFRYDEVANVPLYITPIYNTGTVAVTSGAPGIVGTGTSWLANVAVGDKIHIGADDQDSATATWYTVLTVVDDTHITLTANYVGSTTSGLDYTARKLFTADDKSIWSADVFPDAPLGTESGLPAGDRWFAANGAEVVAWDGNADQVVVISTASDGLGFACREVLYYKNMMLYGGIVESSTTKPANVKNTAIGDPENVSTLEANELIVAQSVDFLLTLRRLGDYAIAYCSGSVNVIQFVDAPVYFAVRTAAPRIGILGRRSVADYGDYHEFLAKDQAYRFDGLRLIPFGNQVFDELVRVIDRDRLEKASAFISEEKRETYWVLPLTTDSDNGPASGWVEHYAEPAKDVVPFTKRDLPATSLGRYIQDAVGRFSDYTGYTFASLVARFSDGSFAAKFPVTLFGDEEGYIRQLDTQTQQDDETVLRCFATSPLRPLADSNARGVVRRVEPFLTKKPESGELTIRVETTERAVGDYTPEEGTVALDQSGDRFLAVRNPGRHGRVTFETLLAGQNWELEGYKVVADELGER